MKCYIVIFSIAYEGDFIKKVFDTYEKAEQYKIKYSKDISLAPNENVEIKEFEIE